MGKSVGVDDLTNAIMAELETYSSDVSEKMKEAVDEVAKETKAIIKRNTKFQDRSGDYRRSFRLKKVSETAKSKKVVWRAQPPEHALTHLLEHGHKSKNGGSVRAYPHIKYGDEYVQEKLPDRIKEKIESLNK